MKMENDIKKMSDSQLVEVLYGSLKYPIEFREQCDVEIERRRVKGVRINNPSYKLDKQCGKFVTEEELTDMLDDKEGYLRN